MEMRRINFLDGFRGIAILLVILYHAYARWPLSVPYGSTYANLPLVKQGWLGVHLFFMISGFVILMTLDKTKNFLEFITKRWLRLFPAMLVVTALIFLTAQMLPERPEGIPKLSDIIPGLMFVEPDWIHAKALDGAFWSLFVEMKYYFIFGALYFYLGKHRAIIILFVCFCLWLGISLTSILISDATPVEFARRATEQLSFRYFGWFACGSLAYLYYTTRNRIYMVYALITGFIASTSVSLPLLVVAKPAYIILILFLAATYFDGIKKFFANGFLVFFGFISYPLYLIHQNTMIALIAKMNRQVTIIPKVLLPIIPFLFLILVSYVIAKILEPTIRKKLNSILVAPVVRYYQSRLQLAKAPVRDDNN